MKKCLAGILIFGLLVLTMAAAVVGAEEVEIGKELLPDGNMSNIQIMQDGTIVLPDFPNFNGFGMCSFMSDGNSAGAIVKEGSNAMLTLSYTKGKDGDNSNAWILSSALKAGAGTYTVEFDMLGSGFTTMDFFGIAVVGPDSALSFTEIPCIKSQLDYIGISNSSTDQFKVTVANSNAISGWKHVTVVFDQTAKQAAQNDTICFNLFNKKISGLSVKVDNVSVKKGGKELLTDASGRYLGDFSACYANSVSLKTTGDIDGYGSAYENESIPAFVKDGNATVLKMSFDGVKGHNVTSFYKFLSFAGPGTYQFSFDIKYPKTLTTESIGFRFAGPNLVTANVPIAGAATDLDILPDSEKLKGYKTYSGSLTVDSYTSKDIDSLQMWFDTGALPAKDNWIMVTNLSIKLLVSSTVTEAPSAEGLYWKELVLGGDFEKTDDNVFDPGYQFVSEPTMASYFWGSYTGDYPGKIATVPDKDGKDTQALMLSYDPAGGKEVPYSSAFIFLDVAELNLNDVYELSFDYKTEIPDLESLGATGVHAEFVGAANLESFKMYLGDLSGDTLVTNGANPTFYPFTVTELGNGWHHVKLMVKMNNFSLTNTDSIRFLIDTKNDVANKAYFDNVKFGKYSETPPVSSSPSKPSDNNQSNPTQTEDNGSNGLIIGIVIGAVVLVLAAVVAVLVVLKKKKQSDSDKRDETNDKDKKGMQ